MSDNSMCVEVILNPPGSEIFNVDCLDPDYKENAEYASSVHDKEGILAALLLQLIRSIKQLNSQLEKTK